MLVHEEASRAAKRALGTAVRRSGTHRAAPVRSSPRTRCKRLETYTCNIHIYIYINIEIQKEKDLRTLQNIQKLQNMNYGTYTYNNTTT